MPLNWNSYGSGYATWNLYLGLPLPRHVVVAELGRHVRHVAVVVFGATERDAAVHQPASAEAPPHADVDAVEHLGLRAFRGANDQVVEAAGAALVDVVGAADLIAAAAGQPRIAWRVHAVLGVVGLGDEQVVGHRLVAVPRAEIADGQPESGHHLVLDDRRDLLVPRPDVPAFGHVLRVTGGDDGRAEVPVQVRSALAVVERVGEIAVWNPVAVAIGPAAIGVRDERVGRVGELRQLGRMVVHVAAERKLEGGLPVAEQIVGGADARAEILPVRHVVHGREIDRPEEAAARSRLRRVVGIQPVVADAEVEREPVDASTDPGRRARASASASPVDDAG